MRESGSLELEPSVSVAMPKEPEKAATMPVEPLRDQSVQQGGMLERKLDVDGSGKRASNRYTDLKHRTQALVRNTPKDTESEINIINSKMIAIMQLNVCQNIPAKY